GVGRHSRQAPPPIADNSKTFHAVTSVLCGASDDHFLSASTSSSSGIRLWDMRYQKLSSPLRTYEVPQRRHGKQGGGCPPTLPPPCVNNKRVHYRSLVPVHRPVPGVLLRV